MDVGSKFGIKVDLSDLSKIVVQIPASALSKAEKYLSGLPRREVVSICTKGIFGVRDFDITENAEALTVIIPRYMEDGVEGLLQLYISLLEGSGVKDSLI